MSSYPPGGDYDERLLDNAPRATKAEKQEGYNLGLLSSGSSESPMNARPVATVDGHTSLEAGVPPTKEGYVSPYSVPWYRQKKWRIFMLIGAIVVVGAAVGGAVGGTLGSKHSNVVTGPKTMTLPTSTSTPTSNGSAQSTSLNGIPPESSLPSGSISGANTVSTPTVAHPIPTPRVNLDNVNDIADPGVVVAPVAPSE